MKKHKGLTRDQVIDVIDEWIIDQSYICDAIEDVGHDPEQFRYIFDFSPFETVNYKLLRGYLSQGCIVTGKTARIKAQEMRPLMLALYLAIVEDGGLK